MIKGALGQTDQAITSEFAARDSPAAEKSETPTEMPTPRSLKGVLSGPQREQWKQALELEYNSLIDNGTWRLVQLPPDRKGIPCH
ncbi:Integrase, catalytic core protein [Phytophthora megakarya]|uniref:Integrase, catalytic core protein n=1 Tax=Phytophthora megakarya TaxID=4795 RepID=A0A225WQI2_9STRA|nr:Integrase, catalytic core protein [Phytophthora megakarya]